MSGKRKNSSALFNTFDSGNTLTDAFRRQERTTATNPKYAYELQYKSEFDENEDHNLLISATGNLFAKDQSSDFTNTVVFGSADDDLQQTRTDFGQADYIFKADYTKPWDEKYTLETGAQYQIKRCGKRFCHQRLRWVRFCGESRTDERIRVGTKGVGRLRYGRLRGRQMGHQARPALRRYRCEHVLAEYQ